jgi:hypothetical protein
MPKAALTLLATFVLAPDMFNERRAPPAPPGAAGSERPAVLTLSRREAVCGSDPRRARLHERASRDADGRRDTARLSARPAVKIRSSDWRRKRERPPRLAVQGACGAERRRPSQKADAKDQASARRRVMRGRRQKEKGPRSVGPLILLCSEEGQFQQHRAFARRSGHRGCQLTLASFAQFSMNDFSCLLRDGCRSFRRAFASI